jgi:hypothetical protein
VFDSFLQTLGLYLIVSLLLLLVLPVIAISIVRIGPNEVGLVIKRWDVKRGPTAPSRSTAKRGIRRAS